MTALERLVYSVALAWFRAYWETRTAARLAWREVVTDEDRARADRFRDAVRRLRDLPPGNPGQSDPTPGR